MGTANVSGQGTEQKVSWTPLILVSMAAFVAALDQTFMSVSMSQVIVDLDTDVGTIQTIMSLYTLITASVMLVSAKLQDIYGKRKIFVIGAVFYGIGTTVAAISPNVFVLFLGWALLEGIGGACMSPGIISIVTGTYSGNQRTRALAVSSAITAISAGIGPLFGGVVTSYASWRFGFAFELILVIVILVLHKKIPYFAPIADKKDMDIAGSVTSVLGLLLLIIGILQLDDYKFGLAGGLIIASVVVLALFAYIELKRKKEGKVPLFDVTLLKYRNLTFGTLIILIVGVSMAGAIFSISVYLQSARGFSAIQTGINLLPLTLGMLLVALLASNIAIKLGHKLTMLIGFVLAIIGSLILCRQFDGDATLLTLGPGMFILGMGIELPISLASDTAMKGIPAESQSSCSGLFSTGQTLGMSLGTAVIGVIMIIGANAGLHDAAKKILIPSGVSEDVIVNTAAEYFDKMGKVDVSTLPGGVELYEKVNELIIQDAMCVVMITSAILFVIGILLTLGLKNTSTESAATSGTNAEK